MSGYTRIAALPLAPVLISQARRVRRTTPLLPDAAGPWTGEHAGDDPVDLLVLGDSTAAGVGAPDQDQALPGCLAREIAARFGRGTRWTAIGRNGATSRDVLDEFMPHAASVRFDLALLTIGANDALGLRPGRAFARDLRAIVDGIRRANRDGWIMVSLLPDFDQYELLPQPLRRTLARHARGLDDAGRAAIAGLERVVAMPPPPPYTDDFFAEDRFHPGPTGYRLWAAYDFDSAPQIRL